MRSHFKLLSFSVPISEFQQRFDKEFCCYSVIIIMVLKVYINKFFFFFCQMLY